MEIGFRMPTIVSADSISSLSSRSLGDPFVEIAWLSTVTLEQYERLIERDDSFAHAVLRWLSGWFYKNDRASTEEQCSTLFRFLEGYKLDSHLLVAHFYSNNSRNKV